MPRRTNDRSQELLVGLKAIFAAAPWTAVALMFVLSPKQWKSLLNGDAHELLRDAVKRRSLRALATFGLHPGKYADDIAHEVLLKLIEGKFQNCFNPETSHSRGYLLGSAYQYARTTARSFWRAERGNRELPSHSD